MAALNTAPTNGKNVDDLDPHLDAMLERKRKKLTRGEYRPLAKAEVTAALNRLLAAHHISDAKVEDVHRLAGGASKEQFLFTLAHANGRREKLVLRMDPTSSVLETSRVQECEILRAMHNVVPVPEVRFLDASGEHLGLPGMITAFVSGTTKPTQGGAGVSGLGTGFTQAWREQLTPQFIDILARIHRFDFRRAALPSFGIPDANPEQAALWRVNLWSQVWRDSTSEPCPIFAVTESWLRNNLPKCEELVLVHGDFRTGNYLFDEDSKQITAILDWELAHIGDFHEDIAWSLVEIFGARAEDGTYLCSNLMSVDDYIAHYEAATGRTVNRKTLLFYRILLAWSVIAMAMGTGIAAAKAKHSHQDILLTWLANVTPPLIDEISRLLLEENKP